MGHTHQRARASDDRATESAADPAPDVPRPKVKSKAKRRKRRDGGAAKHPDVSKAPEYLPPSRGGG